MNYFSLPKTELAAWCEHEAAKAANDWRAEGLVEGAKPRKEITPEERRECDLMHDAFEEGFKAGALTAICKISIYDADKSFAAMCVRFFTKIAKQVRQQQK